MRFWYAYSLQFFRCENSIVNESAVLAEYVHDLYDLLEHRIIYQILQALYENF